jgi:hypothetical protein
LRSTCALARLVMGRWDIKWKERMKHSTLEVEDDGRFVDDARVFMYPLRAGWRWEQGELWFSKEWEQQDQLLSPTERTKRAVFGSMQGLTKCLNCLIRSLGNEVGRRLDSCTGSVGVGRRVAALDRFSQKMLNSGHKVETIRNILVSGIKGFKRRVARSPGQWNFTPQKCKPELWC